MTPEVGADTGPRPDERVLRAMRRAALVGAGAVAVVSVVVLVGWAADLDALKRVEAGFAPMKANAAVCYLLVTAVVVLELRPVPRLPGWVAPAALGLVATLAGLTALEHLAHVDLRIDQLLVHDGEPIGAAARGRMSLMGAVCLLLLVVALVALHRRAHRLAQSAALVAVLLSSIGLLGFLYDVHDLYDLAFFKGLAVLSGGALVVLSLCVLCLDGESWLMGWVTRDSPEGWAIRVLLPGAYLAPVTLAYVVVTGTRRGWFTLPIGAAVAVPVMTVACVAFVGLVARRLHDSELARRRVAESLAVAHDELGRRVEYAGIVAHDLRNPLAAILVYARLLEDERFRVDPDRVLRHASQIVHVAETMGVILDDILSVSRLEAGQLNLERGRLELVDFLDALQLQAEASHPDTRVRLDLHVGEVWVEADAVQLSRVLLNLLSNAVKFTPEGVSVTLVLRREQDEAVVRVVDRGPGIDVDDVPVLFEKFSRLPSGAKLEGSGLGLFICRSIVEAHDGRIWVEDTEGGGATFCVALPAVSRRVLLDGPPSLVRATT